MVGLLRKAGTDMVVGGSRVLNRRQVDVRESVYISVSMPSNWQLTPLILTDISTHPEK